MTPPKGRPDCGTPKRRNAKSVKATLISQIVRLVRKEGLDYEGWRYVVKQVQEAV